MARILTFLAASVAFGQAPAELPQFEVASVKMASDDPVPGRILVNRFMSLEGGPGTDSPGQIICTACDLSLLITTAYEVSSSQINLRGVAAFERYDIVAKVPRGRTLHDLHLMLRRLLAERFHLQFHREKRPGTVYALILGKKTPSLQRADEEVPGAIPYPALTGNHLFTLTARHKSIQQLAEAMSMFTDAPVVDSTGMQGGYDFTLYWMVSVRSPSAQWIPVLEHPKKRDWPPGMRKLALRVEDAARQQLGLKLVTRKMPVDLLIVDSVSRVPVAD